MPYRKPGTYLITVKVTGVLLGCGLLAEAVVGGALFHQQVGVGLIQDVYKRQP